MPATVVRRSVKGVAWSGTALLTQSSDLSASECDIRVSTGVGALLIIWWGGARVVDDIRVSTGVGALLTSWWGGARVVEYR